ncbi:hypothetical protein PAPYR_8600 [Paratrimastix pyriformis]|uniref:Uncharacterized protein n=1 Tax=Paratrimastix pyriformis TaxID=342808 RepID=A0ABQ8UAA4_9EUKA|nr:hypothetical protein PAPYR_8600 [Paratrimastix pyriformis]
MTDRLAQQVSQALDIQMTRIAHAHAFMLSLGTQLVELRSENDTLRAQIAQTQSQEGSYDQAMQEIDSLHGQVLELNELATDKNREVTSLRATVTEQEAAILALRQQLEAAHQELGERRADLTKAQLSATQLHRDLRTSLEEVNARTQETVALHEERAQLVAQVAQLQSEMHRQTAQSGQRTFDEVCRYAFSLEQLIGRLSAAHQTAAQRRRAGVQAVGRQAQDLGLRLATQLLPLLDDVEAMLTCSQQPASSTRPTPLPLPVLASPNDPLCPGPATPPRTPTLAPPPGAASPARGPHPLSVSNTVQVPRASPLPSAVSLPAGAMARLATEEEGRYRRLMVTHQVGLTEGARALVRDPDVGMVYTPPRVTAGASPVSLDPTAAGGAPGTPPRPAPSSTTSGGDGDDAAPLRSLLTETRSLVVELMDRLPERPAGPAAPAAAAATPGTPAPATTAASTPAASTTTTTTTSSSSSSALDSPLRSPSSPQHRRTGSTPSPRLVAIAHWPALSRAADQAGALVTVPLAPQPAPHPLSPAGAASPPVLPALASPRRPLAGVGAEGWEQLVAEVAREEAAEVAALREAEGAVGRIQRAVASVVRLVTPVLTLHKELGAAFVRQRDSIAALGSTCAALECKARVFEELLRAAREHSSILEVENQVALEFFRSLRKPNGTLTPTAFRPASTPAPATTRSRQPSPGGRLPSPCRPSAAPAATDRLPVPLAGHPGAGARRPAAGGADGGWKQLVGEAPAPRGVQRLSSVGAVGALLRTGEVCSPSTQEPRPPSIAEMATLVDEEVEALQDRLAPFGVTLPLERVGPCAYVLTGPASRKLHLHVMPPRPRRLLVAAGCRAAQLPIGRCCPALAGMSIAFSLHFFVPPLPDVVVFNHQRALAFAVRRKRNLAHQFRLPETRQRKTLAETPPKDDSSPFPSLHVEDALSMISQAGPSITILTPEIVERRATFSQSNPLFPVSDLKPTHLGQKPILASIGPFDEIPFPLVVTFGLPYNWPTSPATFISTNQSCPLLDRIIHQIWPLVVAQSTLDTLARVFLEKLTEHEHFTEVGEAIFLAKENGPSPAAPTEAAPAPVSLTSPPTAVTATPPVSTPNPYADIPPAYDVFAELPTLMLFLILTRVPGSDVLRSCAISLDLTSFPLEILLTSSVEEMKCRWGCCRCHQTWSSGSCSMVTYTPCFHALPPPDTPLCSVCRRFRQLTRLEDFWRFVCLREYGATAWGAFMTGEEVAAPEAASPEQRLHRALQHRLWGIEVRLAFPTASPASPGFTSVFLVFPRLPLVFPSSSSSLSPPPVFRAATPRAARAAAARADRSRVGAIRPHAHIRSPAVQTASGIALTRVPICAPPDLLVPPPPPRVATWRYAYQRCLPYGGFVPVPEFNATNATECLNFLIRDKLAPMWTVEGRCVCYLAPLMPIPPPAARQPGSDAVAPAPPPPVAASLATSLSAQIATGGPEAQPAEAPGPGGAAFAPARELLSLETIELMERRADRRMLGALILEAVRVSLEGLLLRMPPLKLLEHAVLHPAPLAAPSAPRGGRPGRPAECVGDSGALLEPLPCRDLHELETALTKVLQSTGVKHVETSLSKRHRRGQDFAPILLRTTATLGTDTALPAELTNSVSEATADGLAAVRGEDQCPLSDLVRKTMFFTVKPGALERFPGLAGAARAYCICCVLPDMRTVMSTAWELVATNRNRRLPMALIYPVDSINLEKSPLQDDAFSRMRKKWPVPVPGQLSSREPKLSEGFEVLFVNFVPRFASDEDRRQTWVFDG